MTKVLTYGKKLLYNNKACIGDEVRCGYTKGKTLMEGTLMEYVVAKTKAVSLKTISTYPKIIMQTWAFILVTIDTPGCVYNFRPKIIF